MFAPWDLGPTVRITVFTLTALSTCVVGLRFYCRLWVVGKLKLYDYIMLAALLCTWGLCVTNHYQLITGAGSQLPRGWKPPEPTPENMKIYEELLRSAAISWFVYRMVYVVCLGLIKLSILVFYLSFATSRSFRRLVLITMVVVGLFTVITGFLNGFECPTDPSVTLSPRIFDPRYASKCLQRPILYYCQAAFNIFSDAWILVLPMPSLLKLSMPRVKRYSLIGVFSVGLLVPIASGIRIWSLYAWANSGPNARYMGAYMIFWSQVEINTAIICASAPSLQPILKRIFGRICDCPSHSAYYYYGDGPQTVMEERVGNRRVHETSVSSIVAPSSTYQPNKRSTSGTEHDFVFVQELDEEQQIRDRIRHFVSQNSLKDSHGPSPPQMPKEILPYG